MTKQHKHYSNTNLFIRSLLYSILIVLSAMIDGTLCILALPFPLRVRYQIGQYWMSAMPKLGKVLCHMDYHIEGLEHIKKIKNGIIFSKHQSAWETLFLGGIADQVVITVKKEFLWVPFFGWGLAALKPIAINRSKSRLAIQQLLQQGQYHLKKGRWVLIFPEGTRTAVGHTGKYRMGGACLAAETGYPMIPVAHNAGRCWPRNQFLKRPGLIRVVIGPPIYPKGRTPEELLKLAKNWIEDTMKKIDSPSS